jgi:hypothetical protein
VHCANWENKYEFITKVNNILFLYLKKNVYFAKRKKAKDEIGEKIEKKKMCREMIEIAKLNIFFINHAKNTYFTLLGACHTDDDTRNSKIKKATFSV